MKPCIIVAVLVISACGDTGGLETESTALLSPVVDPSQPATEPPFTPTVRLVAPGPLWIDEWHRSAFFTWNVARGSARVDDNTDLECLMVNHDVRMRGYDVPLYHLETDRPISHDMFIYVLVVSEYSTIPNHVTNRRFVVIPAGHTKSRSFYLKPGSPAYRITIIDAHLRANYLPVLVSRHPRKFGKVFDVDLLDTFPADLIYHSKSSYEFRAYNVGSPSTLNFPPVH